MSQAVLAAHQQPLAFTPAEATTLNKYVKNKRELKASPRKAFVSSVERPNSGSRLHGRARIASENRLGLTLIRHLVEQNYSPQHIMNILSDKNGHRDEWERFKRSSAAITACNGGDFNFTHPDEIQKPASRYTARLSRICRMLADLLVVRTSSLSRVLRSLFCSNSKVTLLTAPLYVVAAMCTNLLSVKFRVAVSASNLSMPSVTALLYGVSASASVVSRACGKASPVESITDNQLEIARFRALEMLQIMAKTSAACQSTTSKDTAVNKSNALNRAKDLMLRTENNLSTKLHRAVYGSHRSAGGNTPKGLKLQTIEALSSIQPHEATCLKVIQEIKNVYTEQLRAPGFTKARAKKAMDYIFTGVKAYAHIAGGASQGLQAKVCPGVDLKRERGLGGLIDGHKFTNADGTPADLPAEEKAKRIKEVDFQALDKLVDMAKKAKKATCLFIADTLKVAPLNTSSKSIEGSAVKRLRQSAARRITYNPKGNPNEVKTRLKVRTNPLKRKELARKLDYALEHEHEYGKVSRFLLAVTKQSEFWSFRVMQAGTGNVGRLLDKFVFQRLAHTDEQYERSSLAQGLSAGIWSALATLAFPPTLVLFGGLDLLKVVSTTALGVLCALPGVLAAPLAQITILMDWNQHRLHVH